MKLFYSFLLLSLMLLLPAPETAFSQNVPDFDLIITVTDQGEPNDEGKTPISLLTIGLDPAASNDYEDDKIGPPQLPPGETFGALIQPSGEEENYITDIRKSVAGPAVFEYEFAYQTEDDPIEIAWDNAAIPAGVNAEIVDPLDGSFFQYDMNENSSLSIDEADGTGPHFIPNPLIDGVVVRFTVLEAPTTSVLSGSVTYFPGGQNAGRPLEGVELTLGGDASASTVTAADGTYTIEAETGGRYTLSAAKADDAPPARGVSARDMTLIRRHILNINSLNSPYEIIAADVNESGEVSARDVTLGRRLILRINSDLGDKGLWQCVVARQTFDDPQNPFPFETARRYAPLGGDQGGQDFHCFRRADVNGSWTPAE